MKYGNVLLLFFYILSISNGKDYVTYYEGIINLQTNKSIAYQYPKDASEYAPHEENEIKDFGTFDFIIVGAGASGTVLANRLSEIKQWKILLLEAGCFGSDVTDMPNMIQSIKLSHYNWGYKSVPQSTACLDMVNQQCAYTRGKGVGGTTLLNNLIYARGCQRDFDRWAEKGNSGWSYKEVLPYFKKSENLKKTDPDVVIDDKFHSHGGYLNVEYPIPRHPQITLWLEANKEKGYKIIDYNGEKQIGSAVYQQNINRGKRADDGNAFIKPIKNRQNLQVLTESLVTKVVIDQKRKVAKSVIFVNKGQTYIAKATKEVILSAGSIGSPQLLMLSGIGPCEHLRQVGIQPIQNLEVGTTLKDHPMFFGLIFDSNYTKIQQPLRQYVKEYINGTGTLTTPDLVGGVGFYQTKFEKESNFPDLELVFTPVDGFSDIIQQKLSKAKEKTWQHLDTARSFAINVAALHAKSVGTIRLKSSNPFDYPSIDSQFLSDPEHYDIDVLYEGIRIALNIVGTRSFAKINATLHKQNLSACEHEPYMSKGYWYCVLRHFTGSAYHFLGTCPMGADKGKGAVVDAHCKVHGIGNLRVVDASIFPFPLSGHPSAVCVMIGEKISDSVKLQYL